MIAETTPTVSPDWLLRGGYLGLCVYRPDTFETLVTRRIRSVAFAEQAETRVLNDGTLDEVRRSVSVAPEIVHHTALTALRRWESEGVTVRAFLISARQGPHLIWDDDVPVILTKSNGGLNTLAGDRLLLHSDLYASSVEHSPDLLGTFITGGPFVSGFFLDSRVLPIPGLSVWCYGGTVEAFDSAAVSLGSATTGVEFVLPANTWSVTVSGDVAADRPILITRPMTEEEDKFVYTAIDEETVYTAIDEETAYTTV